jgi:hypothetical protein
MMALAHCLSTASNFLAALSSAPAAYFWYQASQVKAPTYGYGVGGGADAKSVIEYAQESGRRNKIAALWSAAAAAFAFLAHRIHDDLWLQFLSGRDDCERGGSFGFFTV